ncbi:MAG: septum formation protein Maf [Bacteroidetes bacterium]|nr:septum formation protein Maf [Bacteroidota bacterium]
MGIVQHPFFILASRSPRRQQLLRQIGLRFDCIPSTVDERLDETVPPAEHVAILAERKARDVASRLESGIIVGADTIVVHEGEIIEKPTDAEDAARMLRRLSNQRHDVYTAFSLMDVPSWRVLTRHVRTEVHFRALMDDEIETYIASGSPMDKAGAYGIQDDFGAVFVKHIVGDYYNVVGLPLCDFYCAFRHFTNNRHEGCDGFEMA